MDELTPPEENLSAGASFAGLRVERELGRGGAGVVYLARDEALDRFVALKILHQAGLSEDTAAITRFRNEAQIAAKLEHPAIIPIYTTGVERGMTFLAMRYVPGRSLDQVLNEDGPVPLDEAIRLLRPIAAALDYAADHGIVHRDVKPGNILVDESVTPRRALLGDFGIARAYEGTRHTATGGWVGTPDYIAPEILKDEPATSRADQYSLACVLVELISGTSPFKRSNTAATITAQVTETPDLTVIPDLGTQTETAIGVALEKNPEDRYITSSEFLTAVEHSVGRDSREAPVTIVRKRKRSKRTRHLKVAGGVILSLLAIGAGLSDVLNLKTALFGSSPAQSTPTADKQSPTEPADVLVIGAEYNWNSSWQFVKGQDASTALASALAENPQTSGLKIQNIPAAHVAGCGDKIDAALAHPPKTAIVVFQTACQDTVVRSLRKYGERLPPTYYVAGIQPSELAYMGMTPSSLYDSNAAIARDLEKKFGKPTNNRIALLTPLLGSQGAFEVGVFSRTIGNETCAVILEKSAPASLVTSQPMSAEYLRVGRGPSKTAAPLESLMTGNSAEAIQSGIDSAKQAGVDCLMVPNVSNVESWAKSWVPAYLKALPRATVYVPSYLLSLIKLDQPRDWSRIIGYSVTIPPTDPALSMYRASMTEAFGTSLDRGTIATPIYLAASLIAAQKPASSPKDVAMPEIPSDEWHIAASDGTLSLSTQPVIFDPATGFYSGYDAYFTRRGPSSQKWERVWAWVGGRPDPLDVPTSIDS